MPKILLLNGPNLNLLGTREPDTYGNDSLADIESRLRTHCEAEGHQLQCLQSNAEHVLIDAIHAAGKDDVAYIIFNPAAFTHTSVALRDALLAVGLPFIELHLSNTAQREPFRHHSYFSDIASGVITGFGALGYELALKAGIKQLENTHN